MEQGFMTSQHNDQPDPNAALLINCGVGVPPEHVATIAKMHQAAAAGRDAIRAVRLGETEPATFFVPLRERTGADNE
jgi:hypothetical protein